MIDNKTVLACKKLFNESGDIEVHLRKMIGGNTTNLNDFNNMKYTWASEWYRQAMNNFWIPSAPPTSGLPFSINERIMNTS